MKPHCFAFATAVIVLASSTAAQQSAPTAPGWWLAAVPENYRPLFLSGTCQILHPSGKTPSDVARVVKHCEEAAKIAAKEAKRNAKLQPTPGSFYTWDLSVLSPELSGGSLTVFLDWTTPNAVLTGTPLHGSLRNSTPLSIRSAIIHLRLYHQPLDGVVLESLTAVASSISPNNQAVFDIIGEKILPFGCAVQLDSIDATFTTESGRPVSKTFTEASSEPFWYSWGYGCRSSVFGVVGEEKKYKVMKGQ